MEYKIAQIRQMTDDELIALNDAAWNVSAPGSLFFDELNRRALERSQAATEKLARRAYGLTVATTVLSVVATVAAVLALFIR